MIVRVLNALSRDTARRIGGALPSRGVYVAPLARGERVLDRMRRETFDLVLVETSTRDQTSEPPIEKIRSLSDRPEVVVVAKDDPEANARLTSRGAMAIISSELPGEILRNTLAVLVTRRREDARRALSVDQLEPVRLEEFDCRSAAMNEFLELADRVADSDASLLIQGETGVGKEYFARAIHAAGKPYAPFVVIDCSAVPESLLESELFGHVQGAFTGATHMRRGQFELAHGGTVLLDEIGELPLHLQTKLLRVLQERTIQPVGSETAIAIDVRVMAATNRDLREEVRAHRFRADLYYRLVVVTLNVPSLRSRRADIPAIARQYVMKSQSRLKRGPTEITDDAMTCLTQYDWPGNVRELVNVIERAVLLARDGRIGPEELPAEVRGFAETALVTGPLGVTVGDASLFDVPWITARDRLVTEFERRYFETALKSSGGRVGEAAARAGISPRALYSKMKEIGLHKEDFKRSSRGSVRPSTEASPGENEADGRFRT